MPKFLILSWNWKASMGAEASEHEKIMWIPM